jgi:urea transport system substrate-binding protein
VSAPVNSEFIGKWKTFIKNDKRTTNDPMEATYIGFNLWVKAVEKAGTADPEAVQKALIGLEVPNLTGGMAKVLPNHHITKPVLIGEIQDNGQFDVVWKSNGLVEGDAWSDFLEGSKNLIADWTDAVKCGAFDQTSKTCKGAAK